SHRAVVDEHRVREAGDRQLAGPAEQPLAHEHRPVQRIELVIAQKSHEVRFGSSLVWRGLSPRQGMALGIARDKCVHDSVDDLLQRPTALERISAEPTDCVRSDAAEARRQRALESVGMVGPAQRLEVADQKAHHLVARGGAPAANLISEAKGAKRLFERGTESRRAAQNYREVTQAELGPLCVQALDLPRAEERLVDGVRLARKHDRRRAPSRIGDQHPRRSARLGCGEETPARVQRLLRGAVAGPAVPRRQSAAGGQPTAAAALASTASCRAAGWTRFCFISATKASKSRANASEPRTPASAPSNSESMPARTSRMTTHSWNPFRSRRSRSGAWSRRRRAQKVWN